MKTVMTTDYNENELKFNKNLFFHTVLGCTKMENTKGNQNSKKSTDITGNDKNPL